MIILCSYVSSALMQCTSQQSNFVHVLIYDRADEKPWATDNLQEVVEFLILSVVAETLALLIIVVG